jgi:transposase
MEKKKPKLYTEEFRRQAVTLAEELGSVMKAAHQLGVSEANIYSWRKTVATTAGASKASAEEELKRLRKENSDLKKINHVLKAAAAFFSQDHLK